MLRRIRSWWLHGVGCRVLLGNKHGWGTRLLVLGIASQRGRLLMRHLRLLLQRRRDWVGVPAALPLTRIEVRRSRRVSRLP